MISCWVSCWETFQKDECVLHLRAYEKSIYSEQLKHWSPHLQNLIAYIRVLSKAVQTTLISCCYKNNIYMRMWHMAALSYKFWFDERTDNFSKIPIMSLQMSMSKTEKKHFTVVLRITAISCVSPITSSYILKVQMTWTIYERESLQWR